MANSMKSIVKDVASQWGHVFTTYHFCDTPTVEKSNQILNTIQRFGGFDAGDLEEGLYNDEEFVEALKNELCNG